MGQIEVYETLRGLRCSGEDSFYSVKEVEGKMRDTGASNGVLHGVRGDLIRLELTGYLEVEMSGKMRNWRRMFRLKKKYAKRR